MTSTIETPWGPAQHSREIAPGITEHSTAGHGGLQLSPERWAEMNRRLPGYTPQYAPAGWLEEDCDYCVAVLAFPELFTITQIRCAVQTFSSPSDLYQPLVRLWLSNSSKGRELRAQVQAWEKANAHLWEWNGSGSNDRGWAVCFRRVGDRAERIEQFADYPEKQFYSDSELAALALAKEPPKPLRQATGRHFDEHDCSGVFDGNRVWSETELGGAPGF